MNYDLEVVNKLNYMIKIVDMFENAENLREGPTNKAGTSNTVWFKVKFKSRRFLTKRKPITCEIIRIKNANRIDLILEGTVSRDKYCRQRPRGGCRAKNLAILSEIFKKDAEVSAHTNRWFTIENQIERGLRGCFSSILDEERVVYAERELRIAVNYATPFPQIDVENDRFGRKRDGIRVTPEMSARHFASSSSLCERQESGALLA